MLSSAPGKPGSRRAGRRLLVVDDDPFYRDMASAALEGADYEVITAPEGAQGLGLLRATVFDIAVVDLTMPGLDGFELIRLARAESCNTSIPIIVVTGQEDTASLDQAFEAGATSFVAKPLNWPLFVHHVNFVHRAGKAESDLREAVRTVDFLSNLRSKVVSVLVGESQMPLKTAQGMAELLRREVYGPVGHPVYREYVEDLRRALEQLAATQLKMLNAGQALASGLLLHEEPVGLADVVREAVDGLRDKATRRAVELEVRSAVPPGVCVRGDRALISQAIKMLLDSSVSYAPRRSSLVVDARVGVDGSFSFSVHDEAPAIPDSTVREIMASAPGRPVDASLPAAARNTSLTISRVLVEAHQGRMAINSAAGEGTLVRLLLPKERLTAGSAGPAVQATPSAGEKAPLDRAPAEMAPVDKTRPLRAQTARSGATEPPPALRFGASAPLARSGDKR